jgi:predicted dithiol-disulfide oxidoreductase (DUF899 family)
MNLPEVVSENEWQRAHEKLLAKEKAYLREGDKLAAERRREPMHEIAKGYRFDGPDGEVSLLDLFEGRASSGSITYVRAQPGGGLRRLLDVRRSGGPPRAPARPRRVV